MMEKTYLIIAKLNKGDKPFCLVYPGGRVHITNLPSRASRKILLAALYTSFLAALAVKKPRFSAQALYANTRRVW